MRVRVEVYGFLRNLLKRDFVEIDVSEGSDLKEVLSKMTKLFPALAEVIGANGEVKPHFILFVNGVDYQLVGGYSYGVRDGDVVQILPISHGGSLASLESYLAAINSVRVSVCIVDGSLAEKLLKHVDSVGPDCVAQVLPRKYYYGLSYSALVAFLTLRAVKLELNISRKKSLEYLLYYFGDRNINNVINKLRSSERSEEYVAILACASESATKHENVFTEHIAKCEKRPEDLERLPYDVVEKLVSGVIELLT